LEIADKTIQNLVGIALQEKFVSAIGRLAGHVKRPGLIYFICVNQGSIVGLFLAKCLLSRDI
jgi:hypothetical protein